VRRRPEEDDQEQVERRQRQIPRCRRPADEWWNGARRAADDDVLRRRALQPPRVHQHVEQVPDEGENCGEHVDDRGQQDERERRERKAKLKRKLRAHPPVRNGSPRGPAHRAVDVAVEHVVQRARAPTGEAEADERRCQ
jgi:hypothetical protein